MNQGFSTVMFKVITDFEQFKLLEDVDFFTADGRHFRLPKYAPSDLASTPPAVWGPPLFLPPCGWYGPSVYGHDCAYQNTLLEVVEDALGNEVVRKANLDKPTSDALCREMLHWQKPNPTPSEATQIEAIYEGVTLGGWHAFQEDRS